MLVKVRVTTGAKNERIERVSEDRFDIAVREKPAANQANQRVVALVARELGILASQVRIIRGHHRASKILSVITSPSAYLFPQG